MSQSSKDHTYLCAFTFADGRRCTLPQSPDDMGLCYFHARKFIDKKRAQTAAQQIAGLLDADIVTACDLSAVFNALFTATALGYIKPKAASALAYIGQLMVQTQRAAKEEYIQTFEKTWPDVVYDAPAFNLNNPPEEETQPESTEPAATDSTSEATATTEPPANIEVSPTVGASNINTNFEPETEAQAAVAHV
jgi:hypothetical protein